MEGTNVARCPDCGWVGLTYRLYINDENPDDPCCPACGKDGYLDDVTKDDDFTQEQLAWLHFDSFGEIEIDDAGNIRDEFLGFPAGTPAKIIEDWFNERIDGGVEPLQTIIDRFDTWYADLMNL